MSFQIQCPSCARVLNVTETAFGKTVPCPACKQPIQVANPAQQPAYAGVPASTFNAEQQARSGREGAALGAGAAANPSPRSPAGMPPMPSADGAFDFLNGNAGGLGPGAGPQGWAANGHRAAAANPVLGFLDLGFTRFISTSIVKVIWLVWLVVASLAFIGFSLRTLWWEPALMAVATFGVALLAFALYTLTVRMGLEITIVIFRATEYLREISARIDGLKPR
jgi:phage FluMu protein Com